MCKSKEIIRLCFACKEKTDRKNLVRILQDHKSGEYIINPDKKQFGKSVYIHRNENCITKFLKHKNYKDKLTKEKLLQE